MVVTGARGNGMNRLKVWIVICSTERSIYPEHPSSAMSMPKVRSPLCRSRRIMQAEASQTSAFPYDHRFSLLKCRKWSCSKTRPRIYDLQSPSPVKFRLVASLLIILAQGRKSMPMCKKEENTVTEIQGVPKPTYACSARNFLVLS